jgi:hypothetical protein
MEYDIGTSSKPGFACGTTVYSRGFDTVDELAVGSGLSGVDSGPSARLCLEARHVLLSFIQASTQHFENSESGPYFHTSAGNDSLASSKDEGRLL